MKKGPAAKAGPIKFLLAAGFSLRRSALVLEGDIQPDPVGRDLAVVDGHVLAHHLGDAEVAKRLGRGLDRALGGRFP